MVDEETKDVEERGKPSDHEDDVKGLNPEIHEIKPDASTPLAFFSSTRIACPLAGLACLVSAADYPGHKEAAACERYSSKNARGVEASLITTSQSRRGFAS
jgi:hypothetical protein